jgi:hypothetical protein
VVGRVVLDAIFCLQMPGKADRFDPPISRSDPVGHATAEYLNVALRFADFGCRYPCTGIAFLPVNFESASSRADFLHASEAPTLKKLLKENGVPVEEIVTNEARPRYRKDKAFDWIAPTILISSALYTQNPSLVSVALGVLSNYATDFLKGMGGNNQVKLEVIVERTKSGSFKRISYSGPADGIKNLAEAVRIAHDE